MISATNPLFGLLLSSHILCHKRDFFRNGSADNNIYLLCLLPRVSEPLTGNVFSAASRHALCTAGNLLYLVLKKMLGKIFDNPAVVINESFLKPETQDLDVFVDGVNNIIEAQQLVAQTYLEDGSIDDACPPLKALLTIMARGEYQGKDVHHPEIRELFTREILLASDWYQQRLEIKQQRDILLWEKNCAYLEKFLEKESHEDLADRLGIADRLQKAKEKLEFISSEEYLSSLQGTIGADPLSDSAPRGS